MPPRSTGWSCLHAVTAIEGGSTRHEGRVDPPSRAGRHTAGVRVGLTGGVASGKSTVAGILTELGAVVIDADRLARDVVARGTPGLAAVVDEFGSELLTEEGD